MPIQMLTVTIPAGQSLSNAVDCIDGAMVRIRMPPDWYNAPLSFQISGDNINYFNAFHPDGNEFTMVVLPNTVVVGMRIVSGWIKFRSGTSQRPIAQPAQRDFVVTVDTTV